MAFEFSYCFNGGIRMYDVIGVKFEFANNIYYFDVNNLSLKKGDKVIVDSENLTDFGTCVTEVKHESKDNLVFPLKKVIRKANNKDDKIYIQNQSDADKAMVYAKKAINNLNLNMNIVSTYYTYDKKQLYFTFTADERIDFRELTKKLAQKFKTRIELRQIGVRDKAKLIGGMGPCGLFLCCNTFLTDFNSVSINMAKNQSLALNPSKINGVCGRLLCCLNYEDDVYTELKKDLPKVGSIMKTSSGTGKVISVNIFKKSYKVEIDKNNIVEEYVS